MPKKSYVRLSRKPRPFRHGVRRAVNSAETPPCRGWGSSVNPEDIVRELGLQGERSRGLCWYLKKHLSELRERLFSRSLPLVLDSFPQGVLLAASAASDQKLGGGGRTKILPRRQTDRELEVALHQPQVPLSVSEKATGFFSVHFLKSRKSFLLNTAALVLPAVARNQSKKSSLWWNLIFLCSQNMCRDATEKVFALLQKRDLLSLNQGSQLNMCGCTCRPSARLHR